MSLRVYLHTSNRRAETTALLDCGATENFINERYAQRLHLPVKRLPTPRKIVNVDGSPNMRGDIQFYTDLELTQGERKVNLRFFLTEIGERSIILRLSLVRGNSTCYRLGQRMDRHRTVTSNLENRSSKESSVYTATSKRSPSTTRRSDASRLRDISRN
jgi:hypothetical protein